MLSKEEYTLAKLREHCIQTMQFSNRNSNAYKEHELTLSTIDENISLKYELEQLELDKQKLIEKIENEKICCLQTNNRIEKIVQEEAKKQVEAYKQHILKILKGEKE